MQNAYVNLTYERQLWIYYNNYTAITATYNGAFNPSQIAIPVSPNTVFGTRPAMSVSALYNLFAHVYSKGTRAYSGLTTNEQLWILLAGTNAIAQANNSTYIDPHYAFLSTVPSGYFLY
jgi:hypothetical protein